MMFTVVICTFNRADRVGEAVASVLEQTYGDYELLVVNDGSTDDTAEVLRSFTGERVRVIEQANGGLSAARNTGIREASGRFVAFLDDDDSVSPTWLEGLACGVDPSTGLTSCTCRTVNEEGEWLRDRSSRRHEIFPEVRGVFMAGTFAVDRSILLAIGGYAEQIRVSHQAELLLRAIPEIQRRQMTTVHLEEPLATIERRPPSDRPLSQPADLLHGAEYIVENHRQLMASTPSVLANYLAVAGVSAAQTGDYPSARRHLCQAFVADPRNVRHAGRLVAALVPPLARRTWAAA